MTETFRAGGSKILTVDDVLAGYDAVLKELAP